MTINKYFNHYDADNEQDLLEDMTIESIQARGLNVYYIPRNVFDDKGIFNDYIDNILADTIPSKFDNSYRIEMYLDDFRGQGSEADLFQKFGFESRDEATFVVSKKRFKQMVGSKSNQIIGDFPNMGDLIYLPLTDSLFELAHVERENPFHQLGKLYTFDLKCHLFEFNNEELETGIEAIDSIETLGYTLEVVLEEWEDENMIEPEINIGDLAWQTIDENNCIKGKIVEWDKPSNTMSLSHIAPEDGKYRLFQVGGGLTIGNQMVQRTIKSIKQNLSDNYHQNEAYEIPKFEDDDDEGFEFIDRTELSENPFGSPFSNDDGSPNKPEPIKNPMSGV